MSKPPAFQFYTKDFTDDPMVKLLNKEQKGAYLMLLCTAWAQEEPGILPNDDEMLAPWAECNAKEWAKNRTAILRCFKVLPDGRLLQKRMREEYLKQLARREERAEAGAKGARARWESSRAEPPLSASLSHSSAMAELSRSNGSAMPEPMANDGSSSASSSASASALPESTHTPRAYAREGGAHPSHQGFQAVWAAKTGIAMPDAMTLLEARRRLEAYAEAQGVHFPTTVDRALAEFEAEVKSWSSPQPLTPELFLRKWDQIQARMAGKVPAAIASVTRIGNARAGAVAVGHAKPAPANTETKLREL